jgi:valine--pyruvate aminotransferase
VITDIEIQKLLQIAKKRDIPLIIDSAYAPPFPNLAFTAMTPIYDEHALHCVSLSKAGLPGERVGFVIAHEKYIQAIEPFESNVGIHSSRFGQALATKAFESGRLSELSETVIKPFYQKKLELFKEHLFKNLPKSLNWYIHKVEGSLFSWVWIDHEKMNDLTLYQSLKKEGLIVVPGSSFFPGLRTAWGHKNQCLRFSMTASDADIIAATEALGKVLNTF